VTVPDLDAAQPTEADLVAQAARSVPGVHDLHGGVVGEVATYLPGRRVTGVRLRDEGCAVHVVLDWDADIAGTAERVRAAVRSLVSGPVDVTVEDVAPPPGPLRA
jgi:uncharacterized alkaline shock family protein YloU